MYKPLYKQYDESGLIFKSQIYDLIAYGYFSLVFTTQIKISEIFHSFDNIAIKQWNDQSLDFMVGKKDSTEMSLNTATQIGLENTKNKIV